MCRSGQCRERNAEDAAADEEHDRDLVAELSLVPSLLDPC
jgi:hypothetical protein